MTPEDFLSKFAGREITGGDVATLLGVTSGKAAGILSVWGRKGYVAKTHSGSNNIPALFKVLHTDETLGLTRAR